MWYLVFSRGTGREENRVRDHEEHLEWLLAQHRAGRVLFSGPTADRSCGIYILLATSHAEAERIATQDPHHLHGDRAMEIIDWEPGEHFKLMAPPLSTSKRWRRELRRGNGKASAEFLA
jgi:uncharacterized protein YciI